MNRIEKGLRPLRDDELKNISKVLDVSADYLLDNKNSRYYQDPEVSKIADEMKNNPDLRVLFDASKGLSKESIKEVENFIKFQKMKEGD